MWSNIFDIYNNLHLFARFAWFSAHSVHMSMPVSSSHSWLLATALRYFMFVPYWQACSLKYMWTNGIWKPFPVHFLLYILWIKQYLSYRIRRNSLIWTYKTFYAFLYLYQWDPMHAWMSLQFVWVCILVRISWMADARMACGDLSLQQAAIQMSEHWGKFSTTHLMAENIPAEKWAGRTLWQRSQKHFVRSNYVNLLLMMTCNFVVSFFESIRSLNMYFSFLFFYFKKEKRQSHAFNSLVLVPG